MRDFCLRYHTHDFNEYNDIVSDGLKKVRALINYDFKHCHEANKTI